MSDGRTGQRRAGRGSRGHGRSSLELWDVLMPAELGVRARRAGARRLRRRHHLLGRLQHRAGSDQHREVLHRLPRDARQRLRRAEIDHPLHQPLRRARELPGLPRAAQLDRQDRAQDAGLQGGLGHICSAPSTPARNSSTTGSSWRCTNGRASRPTTRSNAATATARSRWTSPSSRRAPRWRISASCSPARRPASTATRASPTICPTCAASPAGSEHGASKPPCRQPAGLKSLIACVFCCDQLLNDKRLLPQIHLIQQTFMRRPWPGSK